MKYLSIDIETTGLNPLTCDILEIGAYLEDTNNIVSRDKLPCFHTYIWKEIYRGEPYALDMNAHIFKKILKLRKDYFDNKTTEISSVEDVSKMFRSFLDSYNLHDTPLTLAGKNVIGFDVTFLNTLPGWKNFKFRHRAIDPAILYFDPNIDDTLPDLLECKKRANLCGKVSHKALDDAWDVIRLIRHKYSM